MSGRSFEVKNLTTLIISTLFVLMVVPVFSTTIHIPEDYSTIQGGIDANSDGETELTFNGSEVFRDPENNNISITETIKGLISTQ